MLRLERLVRDFPSGFTELKATASVLRKGIFDIKADSYVEHGIPLIRISNLKSCLIHENGLAYITERANLLEKKTQINYGDIALSKTAYPTASFVQLDRANVSQDVIAYKLSEAAKTDFDATSVVSYLSGTIGRALLGRRFQGNVQMHLSLEDAGRVPIPKFGKHFQSLVAKFFLSALEDVALAGNLASKAESVLEQSLGLSDWHPENPPSYQRSLQRVNAAGRFDAEFHSPVVQSLLIRLAAAGTQLRDVSRFRKEVFRPTPGKAFHYLDIGSVSQDASAEGMTLDGADAPSRASWIVHGGDVITSLVRPVRRLSALIQYEQSGAVCSSGFAVLEPIGIAPEVLLTFLRLPIILRILDLHTTASMYPAISVNDLMHLPVPHVEEGVTDLIRAIWTQALKTRARSAALMNRAIQAIDLTLQQSEDAGVGFLRQSETT